MVDHDQQKKVPTDTNSTDLQVFEEGQLISNPKKLQTPRPRPMVAGAQIAW